MFDAMSKEDVVKNAADLKAQMIAGGVSAEQATNKIYGLLSLSNKSGLSAKALGSGDFRSIYDQKTAAQYSATSAGRAFKTKMDKKELINTFDQGLTSIDSYYNSIWHRD